ncbi:family 43 glycosylhydrolase [Paenibacillus oralis]|uniref:family 43 glycosylhydrolase n=1 Tax=Paenibacillus oralis TaxID=2490856 RepID=UPI001C4981DA|nr:family 43 glycosylhydrolase [Paenibacillus oralis]
MKNTSFFRDGKVYFYWGCSNLTPIWGAEINPADMKPTMEPVELIRSNQSVIGYERNGEHHIAPPQSPERIEELVQLTASKMSDVTEEMLSRLRVVFSNEPYIEGAWMDKHNGKYYLQYASPATQYNTYSDGVYVSEHPLGPFTLAINNPYSYKQRGSITGAGHGSTMKDRHRNYWHASSMRISVNHRFERRLGVWPAGFD